MKRILEAWASAGAFFSSLYGEFRSPDRLRERLIDDGEAVLAVLLAVLFAHLLHAQRPGWAAFSGYMVLRTQLWESLNRGLLRVLGTVVGATLAWEAVHAMGHATPVLAVGVSLLGGVSLYGFLTRQHGYAWLFVGLTFAMVVVDALSQPLQQVGQFARTRVVEVVAGTVASLIIGVLSSQTIRAGGQRMAGLAGPKVNELGWHRAAAVHALTAAAALAVLPALTSLVGGDVLTQAAVSIMAVMAIPLANLEGQSNLVSRRALHRFAGCVIGAAVAALCLLASHRSASVRMACLIAGVMLGRHLENARKTHAYVGTQFSLILILTLVSDFYGSVDWYAGLERLSGILLGVTILGALRAAFGLIAKTGTVSHP